MKTLSLSLLSLCLATSALALDKAELDHRIRKLTAKLEAMQANPEKHIPASELRRAKGVILLDRTKAGFIFAFQGGGGVALVKDAVTEEWSPPAFVDASEASLGFQVGGEQNFYVILLMHTNAVRMLTDTQIDFSGEARGTAGNLSAAEGAKLSVNDYPVVVYDERAGLFGGAALKGDAITADDEANRVYYEDYVTVRDVLFDHKVQATDAARELGKKLAEYSARK